MPARLNIRNSMQINNTKILVGITGCIAAYKTCDLVSLLMKQDCQVRCVMTHHATNFIAPLTFQTLSKDRVYVDQFEYNAQKGPVHISLSDFADVIIIMPATANVLAKINAGIADDLLTSLVLSRACPLIVVPAMNTRMWENPITQKNIRLLREQGVHFVDPVEGTLSCGDVGMGHIASTDEVFACIKTILTERK